jgi:hypothetical protein
MCNKEHQKIKEELLSLLENLANYSACNICLHEETYRGGAIWEICSDCGMKWSDDRNPRPEGDTPLPKELDEAYNAISKYKEQDRLATLESYRISYYAEKRMHDQLKSDLADQIRELKEIQADPTCPYQHVKVYTYCAKQMDKLLLTKI